MHTASAIIALAITVVFASSGVAKLLSLPASAHTLGALRLPAVAPRTLVSALAAAELLIAIGVLLAPPLLAIAAAGATLLSVAFLIVVIRAHRLGSTEDCGCFGAADHSRIGRPLIVRNAVLLGVSAALLLLALFGAGGVASLVTASLDGDLGPLLTVGAAALIAALAFAIARSGTAPAVAEPEAPATAPEEKPVSAPLLVLDTASNTIIDLARRARVRAQLAVFIKPGCLACEHVTEHLDEHTEALEAVVDTTVIAHAPAFAQLDALTEADSHVTAIDVGGVVGNSLVGAGSRRPIAALIATDGSVIEPIAEASSEIIELIDVILAAADQTAE